MDNDGMVTESLGTLFRQMRRNRQKSLEDAAAETCINIRALRALESDDYSAIRAEVFVRGFIRNYAEYLGMDPKEAIDIYERSGLRPPAHDPAPPEEETEEETAGTWLPFPASGRVLAGIALLAVLLYAGARMFPHGEDSPAPGPTTMVREPLRPVPVPEKAQAVAPVVREKAPTPTPTPARTVREAAPATPADSGRRQQHPAPPPPPRYTVTATFVEPTWMKLHIDGGPARQYTYHPGEKRVWKARRNIRFFIGNAGGIRLNVNGEDLPPLGPSGEVAKIIIPDGLERLRRQASARSQAPESRAADQGHVPDTGPRDMAAAATTTQPAAATGTTGVPTSPPPAP